MTNNHLNILFGSSFVLIVTLTIASHIDLMSRIKAESQKPCVSTEVVK
jgi:hypothetical protein